MAENKKAEAVWRSICNSARRRNIEIMWEKKNFLKWHKEQPKECHYCKIPEGDFIKIWGSFYGGRRGWRLEVDRRDNNQGYGDDNCVLACALCNCAKSNKLEYEDMKKVGKAIELAWKRKQKAKQ